MAFEADPAGDIEACRHDLSRVLHEHTPGRAEHAFEDVITNLAETDDGVHVDSAGWTCWSPAPSSWPRARAAEVRGLTGQ